MFIPNDFVVNENGIFLGGVPTLISRYILLEKSFSIKVFELYI